MTYEKIVAFYDRTGKARDAARALESSGFSSNDIHVLDRELLSSKDARDGSMWQRLFGRNLSDQENAIYQRTVGAGGAVLTLRTPDSEVNRAIKILNGHGPVDLHDSSASSARSAASATDSSRVAVPPTDGKREVGEDVLRLAEEQLEVGKRQVTTGTSRIRRFVTEKPVEQKITLHEEHCEVARREVPDAKRAGDGRDVDWKDQIIEVVDTSEEPVVSKTARVAEEVVIRRRGSDHVETVRDTVRRQQVQVERVPAANDSRDMRDTRKAA